MSGSSIVASARRWLSERGSAEPVWIVAGSLEAGRALLRAEAAARGAVVGWHALGLDGAAERLSRSARVARGLERAGAVAVEAMVVEAIARAAEEKTLGRFAPLAGRPGLGRSLARTLAELREADVAPAELAAIDPELAALLHALDQGLRHSGRVDRPRLFELATAALGPDREGAGPALPAVLFLDVPVRARIEAELVLALAHRAPAARILVRAWDRRSLAALGEGAAAALEIVGADGETRGPERIAAQLFAEAAAPVESAGLETFSAATEHEEALEIAARIQERAARGTRYADVAVLLREPAAYRAPIEGALLRAGIPFVSARGAQRPDPSGRALLSLIDCALEELSARAFAEYLSFCVLPPTATGAPPDALGRGDLFVEEEDSESAEDDAGLGGEGDEPAARAVRAGSLRAPRRFEALLSDAAVIGGADRWERRLLGLRAALERRATELDDKERIAADLEDLDALTRFALPLVNDLAALPRTASIAEHCDRLAALGTRALGRPRRVLAVLAEVARSGGPARTLAEMRALLFPRLAEVTADVAAEGGAVSVLAIDEARGRSFDVVFLPGLSDGVFPRRILEDAVLRDEQRSLLGEHLARRELRLEDERARLFLAVSSARTALVASHPRTDAERSRPRVPSLYLLELVRAATGALPAVRTAAPPAARTTLGVPADPARAIDATEHDVALVAALLGKSAAGEAVPVGSARYLVVDPTPSGRAVRRAMEARWHRDEPRYARKLTPSDGELSTPDARAILARARPGARTFSASALEGFVACPYRFFSSAVLRLHPREVKEPLVELDPLLKGSIVHSLQFRWLVRMRAAGRFPLAAAGVGAAHELLGEIVEASRTELHEELVPALPRVFDDELDRIARDLRRWVAGFADADWQPAYFELGFGGPRGEEHDEASVTAPVAVPEIGATLRGSIDLVERRAPSGEREDAGPMLRATDTKTGSAWHRPGTRIGGGHALQPVLYALALEKLFPEARVEGGRLHYCSTKGGFQDVVVPLDAEARAAAGRVVAALDAELAAGRVVRWPEDEQTCGFCDYRVVCGPDAASRAERKRRGNVSLPLLDAVREEP